METIKGKNILLIGATGGIGQHLLKLLHSSGANLFITGKDENKLNAIINQYNIDENFFLGDLTDIENVNKLKEKYFSLFSTIDILINAS
jgi:3-oxoacyl-[acyl-carrier protein] reductase